MHAAIASSSINPYMWSWSGPRSRTPVDGEGIDAVTRGIYRAGARRLEQDAHRELVRAAALADELDRPVQVDVEALGELGRVAGRVAGALELLGAPLLDALALGLGKKMCRHADPVLSPLLRNLRHGSGSGSPPAG